MLNHLRKITQLKSESLEIRAFRSEAKAPATSADVL